MKLTKILIFICGVFLVFGIISCNINEANKAVVKSRRRHFYAHLNCGKIIEVQEKIFRYQNDYWGVNGESIPLMSVEYVEEVDEK